MSLRFITALGMIGLIVISHSAGKPKKKNASKKKPAKEQSKQVAEGPIGSIPTKEWNSTNGHKVVAEILGVEKSKVLMKKEDGAVISIALNVLAKADQDEIITHFKISREDLLYTTSDAEQVEGLPYPLGRIHGPVSVNGSNYYVYLPRSLKKDRDAALLFSTYAGGGGAKQLNDLTEVAEMLGWVFAVSVESRNALTFENSMRHTANCLKHITTTLPINKRRIHYSGISGGGAMAFNNTTIMPAYGVMPNVSYIPRTISPKTKAVYAQGGGNDYNRYISARAAELYGKNGFHRMHDNAHGPSPIAHKEDGLFWLQCHGLGNNMSVSKGERYDFEARALKWLKKQKKQEPMRAYSNAIFMKELYRIERVHKPILDSLINELAAVKENREYHEALLAIDKFTGQYLAPIGEYKGSLYNYNVQKHVQIIERTLISKYGHLGPLRSTLNSMKNKTFAPKK